MLTERGATGEVCCCCSRERGRRDDGICDYMQLQVPWLAEIVRGELRKKSIHVSTHV